MILIVGLGNPGQEYYYTRHNVGFWAVDVIAQNYSANNFQKKFTSEFVTFTDNLTKICLMKPQTYMNNSSRSVTEAIKFYKIDISDLIVIHDDLDLDVGTLKIKHGGSEAGHHGLQSISETIGKDYWRIRIGIGRPNYKNDISNYVLKPMDVDDKIKTDNLIHIIANNLENIYKKDFDQIIKDIKKL